MACPEPAARRAAAPGRSRHRSGDPPNGPGARPSSRGQRIRYEEVPFEAESTAHSRFVSGIVQANTLNPDFQQAAQSADSRLAYAALMIGKESIAFNDRSGTAGDFLEKLLDFHFKLNLRKPKRGARRTTAASAEQEKLGLSSHPGRENTAPAAIRDGVRAPKPSALSRVE